MCMILYRYHDHVCTGEGGTEIVIVHCLIVFIIYNTWDNVSCTPTYNLHAWWMMVQYFFKCTQFTIHNVKVPYHALHYTYQSLTVTGVYSIFLHPPLQSQLYCICICIYNLYLQFVFTIVNTICILACCFSSYT